MANSAATEPSSIPLPVELLWQGGWPPAAHLFWSRIAEIPGIPRGDLAADFWSGEKDRCKQANRTFAGLLFAAGRGEEALAALMLAADPAVPQTFEIVLPQLAYAIEHRWDWPTARTTRADTLGRLMVWWRAARGDFADLDRSIFLIVTIEMLEQYDPSDGLPTPTSEQTSRDENEGSRSDAPHASGLVVMAKDKATKLNNFHSEFKDLVDARLPLVVARDCQSAPKFDPVSASKFAPFDRRDLAVALGPSELAGIAETDRARVV